MILNINYFTNNGTMFCFSMQTKCVFESIGFINTVYKITNL